MRKIWGINLVAIIGFVSVAQIAQAVDFSAHGYFRGRTHVLQNLDTQSSSAANNDRFGIIQFNQLRLRVEPTAKINDHLSIHSSLDVLDNIAFGSNDTRALVVNDGIIGTIALPAGGGSLTTVGGAAGENGSINIRRVWADIFTPIGKFRVGRQPQHWGLGMLRNDGNGPQGDFGDSVDGLTYLAQFPVDDAAMTIGAVWDIAYEAQRDPRIGGLASAIRDNGQDTNQWGLFLLYQREEFDIGLLGAFRKRDGSNGSTTTACTLNTPVYANGDTTCSLADGTVGRLDAAGIDGNTRLFIGDAYVKARVNKEISIGAEYAFIGGSITTGVAIDAVPFQGLSAPGIIQLGRGQTMRTHLAALEVEGKHPFGGEWLLQSGFAQGDGSPLSSRVTQYGFRPDYQIGFLMFHYPLGTSPRLRDGTSGAQLAGGVPITGNYINNAIYGSLTYLHNIDLQSTFSKANEFKIGARVLTAVAHKDPVNLDFSALLGDNNMPTIQSRGKWYGLETDLVVQGRFFDNLLFELEGGVLFPGSAFDINPTLVDPGSIVATIPADSANISYGGRLTVSLQF